MRKNPKKANEIEQYHKAQWT